MKTIEQLKAELAAGTITLEVFKAQAKAVLTADLAANTIDQATHDSKLAEVEATTAAGGGGGMSKEEIAKMIQAEADKVRTEYSKKLKESEEALDKIKREKMSEEEKAKHDLEKAQKDIQDRESALLKREVELHAIDVITKKELPLNFREFLVGSSVEDTDKRVDTFAAAWASAIKEAVEKRFKDNGDDHKKGGGGGGGQDNPWKSETFNLTKQGQLLKNDPELAKTLKAAAGVK